MPIEIVTVPCRSDNYAFLIHEAETGETVLVDAPEVAPIKAALDQRGWNLTHILITHHHDDHIAGVDALRDAYGAQVIGAKADAHRLPALDLAVAEGEALSIAGHDVQIFDVSGHTVGHIAFYIPDAKAVFTADSLMALGCGRLFEGTPRMMWTSLSKLAALPEDTIVCSGHEYTAANAKFALTIEPENEALQNRVTDIATARARGEATVPSRLALELATNPFLRASLSAVKASLNMSGTENADVFAEIRARKDRF